MGMLYVCYENSTCWWQNMLVTKNEGHLGPLKDPNHPILGLTAVGWLCLVMMTPGGGIAPSLMMMMMW